MNMILKITSLNETPMKSDTPILFSEGYLSLPFCSSLQKYKKLLMQPNLSLQMATIMYSILSWKIRNFIQKQDHHRQFPMEDIWINKIFSLHTI